MLATKQQSYAAVPHRQPQQHKPIVRRSAPTQHRSFSTWDRVSIVGCIVACAMVFWTLAATNAHITVVNRSIDNLNVQSQKLSAQNSSISEQINASLNPANVLKAVQKQGGYGYQTTTIIPKGKSN